MAISADNVALSDLFKQSRPANSRSDGLADRNHLDGRIAVIEVHHPRWIAKAAILAWHRLHFVDISAHSQSSLLGAIEIRRLVLFVMLPSRQQRSRIFRIAIGQMDVTGFEPATTDASVLYQAELHARTRTLRAVAAATSAQSAANQSRRGSGRHEPSACFAVPCRLQAEPQDSTARTAAGRQSTPQQIAQSGRAAAPQATSCGDQ